ncbi:MAG: A/G-specific adenine glycosylase [Betaproteobacteria bacterium]|nr:A/G-specific adenine glycosylase [Betaproteobacteria bacterium]
MTGGVAPRARKAHRSTAEPARASRGPAPGAGGIDPPSFAPRLVAWQLEHGRHDLPWQRSRDPYRVWVSEIMLQQTRVDTVLRYYEAFLRRFPDLASLAAAELDEVLAQWSGLGYYRRARNLHACARQVHELHGGEFPHEREALQGLAGIGRSTAAAIAAFCFGQREAILDANVQRVLARAFALPRPHDAASLRAMWDLAESLLPETGLDAYTQGLMDLGATLCKPVQPDCLLCPFASDCPRHEGPAEPAGTRAGAKAPARAARRTQRWVLLWARSDGPRGPRVWLQRRDPQGIWPGLWSLPAHDDEQQALERAAQLGEVLRHGARATLRHVLTHMDLLLQPLEVELRAAGLHAGDGDAGGAWFAPEEALALGLPAPVRKLLAAETAGAAGSRAAPAAAARPGGD